MTLTPSNTPITAEHIGYRVRCPSCGNVGEIDDVTARGTVVIRHDASTWHVVPDGMRLSLQLFGLGEP